MFSITLLIANFELLSLDPAMDPLMSNTSDRSNGGLSSFVSFFPDRISNNTNTVF